MRNSANIDINNTSEREIDVLFRSHNALHTEIKNPGIVEYLEKNRMIPPEISPENFGRFNIKNVPQLKEPLEVCHPDHPARYIAIMKSVQSAATVTVGEGAMAYAIAHKYGSVLYLITNKQVMKVRSSSAIDVMIDNTGDLAEKLKPISTRMARKTSDTTYYKEFEGGIKLFFSSYNSIGDLKSNSFSFVIEDEIDEAPGELAGQGDVEGIIEGRTMAARRYKILKISTPSEMESSRIFKGYLEGDQRRYFCACLHCGHRQPLVLKRRGRKYGLTFTTEKDPISERKILIPETVRYQCRKCGGEIYEYDKDKFLAGGEWRPTYADKENRLYPELNEHPKSDRHVSFHSPGLISPFLPWRRLCQKFVESRFGEEILIFKDFTINHLGEPWGASEITSTWKSVKKSALDYALGGEHPPGPVIFFGGVDVQKDRLEIAIIGIGEGFEIWLVDYEIFYGDTSLINSEAWLNLANFVRSYLYHIESTAIDSGYDPRDPFNNGSGAKENIVAEFAAINTDCAFKVVKGVGVSKRSGIVVKRNIGLGRVRYDVQTSLLKEILYENVQRKSGDMSFHMPKRVRIRGSETEIDVDDHLYQSLMSEEYAQIKIGTMGWRKIYERNEVLDTVIYAISMAYASNINSWTPEAWRQYKLPLSVPFKT